MAKGRRFWDRVREKVVLALPGLAVVALVLVLSSFGVLDRAGPLLFDAYQRAAPRPYEDAAVRVVDIDEESIAKLGQWPWPRTQLAELTRRLTEAGAGVIAYDVVFSEADRTSPARLAEQAKRDKSDPAAIAALEALPDNDRLFAETLAQSPVVLGYFLGHGAKNATVETKVGIAFLGSPPNDWKTNFENATVPIPALRAAAADLGFVSRTGDTDGVVRQAPLIASQNGQLLPSLSLQALRVGQQTESLVVKTSDGSGEMAAGGRIDPVSVKVGDIVVPMTAQGEMWVYYTADAPQRSVPVWKIMTGALPQAEMEKLFGGHLVFIGTSAPGLYDVVSTPLKEREAGVMVHAQAAEQIILQKFLTRPDWAPGMERSALLLFGILMALALPWMGATRGALLGLVMTGGMGLASWLAFRQQMMLLDPTYPILGLIGAWVSVTAFTYWREERQRAYIHQAFDRYLAPEMVKRIVDDPSRLELGGEEREMTVLFCDIRGFSRISERLGPQEIIRFLIAFLTPMCDILLAKKATIDKFIGDAILAFWNAPLDDPDQYGNAARGALAMVARLEQLNVEMAAQSAEPWPGDVAIGIGMNAGTCCVGNMGSAQRLSYSLIGDTVNVASRIEGLTKYYGVAIAIGEALQVRLREFATVPLDRVRVVGRDAPETVYALIGDEGVAGTEAFRAFAAAHEAMLLAYRAQDWDGALAAVDAQEGAAAGYGLGKLYALVRERIAGYRAAAPGTDWDGVYGATEK
jgi:adenylate cyclase